MIIRILKGLLELSVYYYMPSIIFIIDIISSRYLRLRKILNSILKPSILYCFSVFPFMLSLILNVWINLRLNYIIPLTYSIMFILMIYNLKHVENVRRLFISILTMYAISEIWEIPIYIGDPAFYITNNHWLPSICRFFSLIFLYFYTQHTPFKFVGWKPLYPYIIIIIVLSSILYIYPAFLIGSATGITIRIALILLFMKINKGFNTT